MCRLFGSLSVEAAPVSRWLVGSERSLLRQSNTSAANAQTDGWGIAWYDGERRSTLVKGAHGAWEPAEKERYLEAAERAAGPLVVGHLRHASNPMGLPKEQLIGPVNSQPFAFGDTLFA